MPAASLLLVVAALSGCGSGSPTEIQGKVTLDGAPVDGVDVQVVPDGSQVAEFSGLSGPDGSFKIAILPNKKYKPGKYKVTASKYVAKDGNKLSGQPGIDVLQLKSMGLAQNALPAIYESPQQTPITLDLTPETKQIDVPLKSK